MKRMLITLVIFAFVFIGCNEKKKETEKEIEKSEITGDQIALGEKLFNERTCSNCHALNTDDLGPSIKDIVKIYTEQNKEIVSFLQGNQEHAIVEKDTNQVAVMKDNVEEFVKNLSKEDLNAISAYMIDIAK